MRQPKLPFTNQLTALTIGMFACFGLQSTLLAATPDAVKLEFFEREIRPLLANHCYECHSVRSKKLQAGLLLDSRASLLAGGDTGPAIVTGKTADSLFVEAIRYEGLEMPPKGKLPQAEIDKLIRWIEMGAPWPDEPAPRPHSNQVEEFDLATRKASHWAWQPIQNPEIPPVKNSPWAITESDSFLLAQLEAANMEPADRANRHTLIRRLYFDLIGLPPTPEEVQAFLDDNSPDAWAELIDRLLASPRFGERWGRHWLDLVRYAESRGHEFDEDAPNAYQFRDYIIRALNDDVPYDQLVREQIAGDLLTKPRLNSEMGFNESILGTGFWFLGEWVHSPVDIRKEETDRFDNMIDVMSKTFLGLTVSCARCHDHKFDAISSADYYSLAGFLQSSDYQQVRFETLEHNRQFAASLATLDETLQQQLRSHITGLFESGQSQLADLLLTIKDKGMHSPWQPLPTALNQLQSETTRQQIIFDYSNIESQHFLQNGFAFGSRPVQIGDLILNSGSDKPGLSVATYGVARYDRAWDKLSTVTPTAINRRNRIDHVARAGKTLRTPTFESTDNSVSCLVQGSGTVVACVDSHRLLQGPLHNETIKEFKPAHGDEPYWVQQPLDRYLGHRLHLEFTPTAGQPLEILAVIAGTPPVASDSETPEVAESLTQTSIAAATPPLEDQQQIAERQVTFLQQAVTLWNSGQLTTSPNGTELAAALNWLVQNIHLIAIQQQESENSLNVLLTDYRQKRAKLVGQIKTESHTAMAMFDGTGEDEHLLIRGNHLTPGEVEPRHFLTAIDGQQPLELPTGSGRLQLAERINAETNPLASRVIVNRIWQHMMGRGIVPTVDDFGVLGQRPSHPELLDHLATTFVRQGQSIKQMIRIIALSQAYQMSSVSNADYVEQDPENRLWQHMPVRRLEGEAIRDTLLAISGQLDLTMYGESIPIHLTPFMEGRGRPGNSGPLNGNNRRTIYVAVRRNFLSPFMLAFDTPAPFSTMGRRNVSNVPAQALILMNDPFVIEQSRHWAKRALSVVPRDGTARIVWMYETAFARPPSQDELQLARQYIDQQSRPKDTESSDLTIWANFAHALINVKEFVFVR